MVSDFNTIVIFTDGSSRGNPGPGGWGTVIIYKDDVLKVRELGGHAEYTTNNRMELSAAVEALKEIKNQGSILNSDKGRTLILYSDSSYLINGITKWIYGWQKNNWLTKTKAPVENKDLWEILAELTQKITIQTRNKIEWRLVGGHIGVSGNERCDEIATQFADTIEPGLYNGSFEKYPVKNILDIKIDNSKEIRKSDNKSHSRAKAHSYVSLVNGVIKIDKTWIECEARVKGVRGAKYKKAVSAEDEKEIIDSFKTFFRFC